MGFTIRTRAAAVLLAVFGAASVNAAVLTCVFDCDRQSQAAVVGAASCHAAEAHGRGDSARAGAIASLPEGLTPAPRLCAHEHDPAERVAASRRARPGDDRPEGTLVPLRLAGPALPAAGGRPAPAPGASGPPAFHLAARPLRL